MKRIGKWEILKTCETRDTDGHLLFDALCTKCGFIKRGARIFNLQMSANNVCNHAIHRGWPSVRLAGIYKNMIARCYEEKRKDYKSYGKKGIRVCEEWLVDPQNFISWATKNGYEENLTIDRINPTKDYCPENCRWLDSLSNSKFKSTTRVLTIDGTTDSLTGHAKRYNIPKTTVFENVRGMTDEEAIEYIKTHSRLGERLVLDRGQTSPTYRCP